MPFSPGALFVAVALGLALFALLGRRARSESARVHVDPFFSFLLAAERLSAPLRSKDGDVSRYRAEVELASKLVLPFFPHDIRGVDLMAKQGAYKVPLRLYTAPGGGICPVVLYFHGGGWVSGSLDSHEGVCRALAASSGCALLSVAYTLAPEARFPRPIEEGLAVLSWIAHAGASLGLDPGRLAVAGDSAGAAIAAALCLAVRDARPGAYPRIGAQVLFVPVTDLSRFDTDSYRRFGTGYMLTEEAIRHFRDLYLEDPAQAADPLASPLRADTHAGLPPAFIVSAGLDPLASDGAEYAARLRSSGVPAQYLRVPGVLHAFIGVPTRPGRDTLAKAGAWLASAFELPAPGFAARRRRPLNLSAREARWLWRPRRLSRRSGT